MDIPENLAVFKIILVGESKVGKTDILYRFARGRLGSGIPTIGVEFTTKIIQLSENQQVKLQIWDTAGQERYRSITSTHYRKSLGAILVYDITKEQTFENLSQQLEEIRSKIEEDAVVMLVGNKKDLVDKNEDERKISQGYASDYAQQHNLLFEEVSAFSGEGIENSFIRMASEIMKRKNSVKSIAKQENTMQSQGNN